MSAPGGTVGMNLHDTTTEAARRLRAGLNGDANQRAATELLINAVDGIWLVKRGVAPVRPTVRRHPHPGGAVDRLGAAA